MDNSTENQGPERCTTRPTKRGVTIKLAELWNFGVAITKAIDIVERRRR